MHTPAYSVARTIKMVECVSSFDQGLTLALQRVGGGRLTLKEEQIAMSCICSEIAHHSEPHVQAAAYLGNQKGPAL